MMVRSIGGMAVAALALWAAPASAQASRTWVSGVGDDVNPCSRTAPCKTFAGAISKTAAKGEINCLDPGGYGAVTITKSITIACDGTFGSILGMSSNGITVAAGPNDVVVLSGLQLQGVGTGLSGVWVKSARNVIVLRSRIQGFETAIKVDGAPNAARVLASGNVFVDNRFAIVGPVGSTGDNLLIANGTEGSFVGAFPAK